MHQIERETMEDVLFESFPKLYRLNGPVVVTEKIDGTNAQIVITDDGRIFAGSRSRFVTPTADNHGFAKWVYGNEELLKKQLGIGRHYGEWWGKGIQRGYNAPGKYFSLFNTSRWLDGQVMHPDLIPLIEIGVRVVPVLYTGVFDTFMFATILETLKLTGSVAAPGYMNPEGIVIYDTRSGTGFKKTFDYDDTGKGGQRDEHGNVL